MSVSGKALARVVARARLFCYYAVKMSSNDKVLKCASCNLVVNELLSFVQNKHDVMDNESLVRICATAFTTEDIETAKSLLFQSLNTDLRQIKRRNKEGKENKDIFDIIEVFKATDPEIIPIFVARDLNKLPPITFDHIDCTRLLKDIVTLQNEFRYMKATCVTVDQLTLTKDDIMNFIKDNGCTNSSRIMTDNLQVNNALVDNSNRNINFRRGACLASFSFDSGPMGLQHLPANNLSTSTANNSGTKISCQPRSACKPPGSGAATRLPTEPPALARIEAASQNTAVSATKEGASGAVRAECNTCSRDSEMRPTVVLNGGGGARNEPVYTIRYLRAAALRPRYLLSTGVRRRDLLRRLHERRVNGNPNYRLP